MAFRENYSDVESIIDGFEIKMEKSKEPVEQSDTKIKYTKVSNFLYSRWNDKFCIRRI